MMYHHKFQNGERVYGQATTIKLSKHFTSTAYWNDILKLQQFLERGLQLFKRSVSRWNWICYQVQDLTQIHGQWSH